MLQMYGVITTVPAPIEMYDAVHAELNKRVGTSIESMLVHVGRATTNGFQVLEVWESKQHYDRANTDILFPPMRGAGWRSTSTLDRADNEAFDVRGIVIPGSNVYI